MKIHRMTAAFGALRQQTLELEDGLNIIEIPNEGGKSTWAAFLRAMLYGIDTKERDKKGVIAEKNRYQPWEGGSMEGSVDLSWQGREITLRRTSKANAPMGQFQAVYTGTESTVPGLTADSAGELLTGVGREVFERSAFVGQGTMAVSGSAELERRVSAIVSSGQEDVSFSEAEQRLRDWRNRRQSNQKNGMIPRLEEEKARTAATLERLEGANRQAAAARAQIRTLEGERMALEREAKAHRALAGARLKAQLEEAGEELSQAEEALAGVRRERSRFGTPPDEARLREMQGELAYLNTLDANIRQARREEESAQPLPAEIDHPVFAGMEPSAAWAKARADAREAAGCLERGSPILAVLAAAGILLLAVLGTVLIYLFAAEYPILYAVPAVACVLALCGVGIRLAAGSRKRTARAQHILDLYGVQTPEEIPDQAEEYAAQWETAGQARREAAARTAALERLAVEREELREQLLETTHAFAPEVTDLYGVSAAVSRALGLGEKEKSAALRVESARRVFQALSAQGAPEGGEAPAQAPVRSEQETAARLNAVREELSRLNETLAMAQGEMNTLGDPAALQARLGELGEELGLRREEYAALTAAMEGLEEANAQLQARMSPALNARAGEILSRLTGGRYDQVSLTREFEALAGRKGEVSSRRPLALSRGTADQIYLAVRLALCELALPGEDPPPLVLDDALVNFDDERLALALDLLRELAGQRQILLFTCQSRERLILTGAPGVHVRRWKSGDADAERCFSCNPGRGDV